MIHPHHAGVAVMLGGLVATFIGCGVAMYVAMTAARRPGRRPRV